MNKLGAELDGRVAIIRMQGEDAAADALARFEKGDCEAGGGKLGGSGKSSDARADDEHVGSPLRYGSDSRPLDFAGLACAGRLR